MDGPSHHQSKTCAGQVAQYIYVIVNVYNIVMVNISVHISHFTPSNQHLDQHLYS